ncbi:tRNA(Met) cytidine acetyltransferase [Pseudoalteromonas sp. MMG013]|uniref:GNAT family N-acetyltransferase n=1 Tax=Pseudoalteromonas sp. MMG013 TaxID=2822687 RepID=UPI001B35DD3F|nr:GNAT family N-acetyltransferase [Pseudoalteromonas sp. MMG013]MBQ4861365.1 tRNA(Met) cytidine acetyltransferase [Pseudoalteromonas sp. MMG013]
MHVFKPCDITPLLTQLAYNKHRQLLLLCGDHNWAVAQYQAMFTHFAGSQLLLSKHSDLHSARWPEHLHEILGQEFTVALYDGYAGIIPNKLAAVSGTVKAGGVLVLLLPELTQLNAWSDPAQKTWSSYGTDTSNSLFLQRWQQLIPALPISVLSQTNGATLNIPAAQAPSAQNTLQQSQVVSALHQHLQQKNTTPYLISADRGRGKSSALGLLVANMPEHQFVICAVQYRAVKSCFKHLAIAQKIEYFGHEKQLANLHYMPPDQLLQNMPLHDTIILIDEAATLPVPTLMKIEQQAESCIFASTLAGYEGNGRGYTLKFAQYLASKLPKYQQLSLTQPIRYNSGDPLEHSINRLLALDSQYIEPPHFFHNALQFIELSPHQLSHNEQLLAQTFALLVIAHYQTSVNDFRQLLDSPSQRLFAIAHEEHIVGVCLVNLEGGLDDTIQQQISSGHRRPQGHLLAQQLFHVQGQTPFLSAKCARIVRIAIAPHLQNKKLGSQLLQFVEQTLEHTVDYFGSSFGCDQPLLRFWQNRGYTLVKLGYKKDKASGLYSAMVIKSQTQLRHEQIQLQAHFQNMLSYQLMNHYCELPSPLVLSIITQWPNKPLPTELKAQLHFIANKNSNLEQYTALIWQVIILRPSLLSDIPRISQQLAISLLLQNNTKEWVQHTLSLRSKKQFNIALQALVKELYARISVKN